MLCGRAEKYRVKVLDLSELTSDELSLLQRLERGPPSPYEELCNLRIVWVHCLREKILNGLDDMDFNSLLEGFLEKVPTCRKAWPFGGEGNESVARILLGIEIELDNFYATHTNCHIRSWKYWEENAPPGGISGKATPLVLRLLCPILVMVEIMLQMLLVEIESGYILVCMFLPPRLHVPSSSEEESNS
ncbi:hypothetical protein V6N13_116033 [Hibiscus sabdariffa]|uniref:Uncharacterized protein n=1 Tax=Hibiscus sabdariffa TaxID=183260 RepID=A0ABR2QSQ1_9ROSI